MNPSISARNFAGGLLGGCAGILFAWYFTPAIMPIGVLLGVVMGWWHKEIGQGLAITHQRARATTGGFRQFVGESIYRFGKSLGVPQWLMKFFRWSFETVLIGGTVAVVTSPVRFHRWLKEHPTHGDVVVGLVAGLFSVMSGAFIAYKIAIACGARDGAFGIGVIGLLIGLFGWLGHIANGDLDPNDMRHYYREWEISSHYGSVGLFAYLFASHIRYAFGIALFVVVMIGWGLPMVAFTFFSSYALALILGGLGLLYNLVRRTGHWLCFGITLSITAASWFIFRHRIDSEIAVWTVALFTGIASGMLTEFVRLPLVHFYEDTKFGAWLIESEPWEKIITGKNEHTYMDFMLGQVAAFWFQDYRLARLFRAICIGTPVARPVVIV